MNISDNGGSDFEQIEPGIYGGVCSKLIDLGTQEDNYLGKITKNRKLLLGFELEHFMADGRPFYVMGTYTASLGEKATLRKLLEGWRGCPFTEQELKGFDMQKVLGQPTVTVIQHTQSGKSKIAALAKYKGEKKPTAVTTYLSLDNFDPAVFESLTKWTKEKIMQSDEWMKRGLATAGRPAFAGHAADDDIPF